jgi:hypothetical protein
MYTSGTKDEHGEKRLSDVRAAMRSQQERSQATRLVGLALADQRSQLDARARWWQRLAAQAWAGTPAAIGRRESNQVSEDGG